MQLSTQNWRSEEVRSALLGMLGNHSGALGNTTVLILAKKLGMLGNGCSQVMWLALVLKSAEEMGTGTQEELFQQWK